jgi:hypothetical protein
MSWYPPLAIAGNGAGQASRSAVRKGDFCLDLLEIEIARQAIQHLTIYAREKI